MSYSIGPKIGIEGENEYRQSIRQINEGIKTLGTEMQAVTSAFYGQEKSIRSLTAENDVLERTIYSLEEKLNLQKKMLQEAANAYGEASEKTQAWQQKVNLTTAELNKAKGKLAENEKAMRELAEGTDEAAKSTSVFSDVLKADLLSEAIKTGIKAVASGIREIGQALADTVKDSAAFADNILTLSTNTGISTETLQEYQYMAELADTSLETITGSMAKLTRSMENARGGTGDAAAAFAALGISVVDANGELRDNEEVFGEVLDALGKMQNATQRDAYAMDIFGKSAQDLNSLIAIGKDGIAAFAKEAHDMGYVLDEETLASLGAVDDALVRLDNFMTTIKNTIGAALAPAITELADELQAWAQSVDWEQVGQDVAEVGGAIKDFVMFVLENGSEILTVIAGVGAGFATWSVGTIISVVGAIKSFIKAAEGASAAQAALNLVMSANPIILVVAAIAALVAAFITAYKTNDEFRAKVDAAWGKVRDAVTGAVEKIKDVMESLKEKVTAVWDGIMEKIRAVTDWIKERVRAVQEFLGIENGSVELSFGGVHEGGSGRVHGGGGISFGGTVNNFRVDDIRTYQQIEQRAVNQQRTTRMGYVGG